jgi:hypothetical protein
MLYSRHLAYKHQPSTLNTFNISEGKFSTFSISLWLSTDSICNLQFTCQESVLSLVGLTGFTMKYQSYRLSGVTSIMTVGRVTGWLYSQPFCYSSPSPGALVVCCILCQRNEYKKTYKCPKNHKAKCISYWQRTKTKRSKHNVKQIYYRAPIHDQKLLQEWMC